MVKHSTTSPDHDDVELGMSVSIDDDDVEDEDEENYDQLIDRFDDSDD